MPPDPTTTPRKRLHRYEILFGLRLLTCSCYRRLPLFDDDRAKNLFVDALLRTRDHHGFALIAWVLMPEHFHLLVIPRLPESPVDALLNMLKSTLSRWARADLSTDHPRFWQAGGGHDRNIRDESTTGDIIRYIHANPVRRGLVAEPTDWPWSSVRWYAGRADGQLPMDDAAAFRRAEGHRLGDAYGSLLAAARAMKGRFGVL